MVRPFRHYRRIKPPEGPSYTVLHHNAPQTDVKDLVKKITPEIEKWRDRLCLSDEAVRQLAWAIGVMRSTDLKEKSNHPEVLKHNELHDAHKAIDDAVGTIAELESELSFLIKFHGDRKSAAVDVFKDLQSAVNSYVKARLPSWGSWTRHTDWHQDVMYLKELLKDVTLPKTGARVGFGTPYAPAIKFIYWALEEKHTAEAIVGAFRSRYGH
jgi:hypothetical protein